MVYIQSCQKPPIKYQEWNIPEHVKNLRFTIRWFLSTTHPANLRLVIFHCIKNQQIKTRFKNNHNFHNKTVAFTQINAKIRWNKDSCKFCMLCVSFCPKKIIKIKDNQLTIEGECISCKLCEKYCPDMGIEVIEDNKSSDI